MRPIATTAAIVAAGMPATASAAAYSFNACKCFLLNSQLLLNSVVEFRSLVCGNN